MIKVLGAAVQAPPCLTKAPFVVQITDTCKECSATQLNMNAGTFEKYLATSTGLIGVEYRQVPVLTMLEPL